MHNPYGIFMKTTKEGKRLQIQICANIVNRLWCFKKKVSQSPLCDSHHVSYPSISCNALQTFMIRIFVFAIIKYSSSFSYTMFMERRMIWERNALNFSSAIALVGQVGANFRLSRIPEQFTLFHQSIFIARCYPWLVCQSASLRYTKSSIIWSNNGAKSTTGSCPFLYYILLPPPTSLVWQEGGESTHTENTDIELSKLFPTRK